MRLRLAGFGRVRSLVIGPRGEGSEDLHRLLDTIADLAAERKWRRMCARNPHEARAVIAARMYRSIDILSVREAAKMKRERLGIALGDRSAASRRRKRAGQFARTMREDHKRNTIRNGKKYRENPNTGLFLNCSPKTVFELLSQNRVTLF